MITLSISSIFSIETVTVLPPPNLFALITLKVSRITNMLILFFLAYDCSFTSNIIIKSRITYQISIDINHFKIDYD